MEDIIMTLASVFLIVGLPTLIIVLNHKRKKTESDRKWELEKMKHEEEIMRMQLKMIDSESEGLKNKYNQE